MRIQRIEIEGFKSYANRVVINDFDKEFNAITGLNGSGKSNILDAICFVLGISNLSHVRATNLNDLVYKQGQTGVNRAAVTITFEVNKNSPLFCQGQSRIVIRRQVTINGVSSYLINGKSATIGRIADLFRSVGLNINNPHFLIMQGRVTKVLNMKPPEILGMIEEAAGTRLYDDKVAKTLGTIEQKNKKMEEITGIIRDDLEPKMCRLNQDKENFAEYQKLVSQMSIAEQNVHLAEYVMSKKQCEHFEQLGNQKGSEVALFESQIEKNSDEIEKVARKHQDLERDRAQTNDGELRILQDRVEETSKFYAALKSECDEKKTEIRSKEMTVNRLEESVASDVRNVRDMKAKLSQKEADFGGAEACGREAEKAVEKARNKLTALAKGMTTNEHGEAATVDGQLINAKSALSDAKTKIQINDRKLKDLRSRFSQKQKELKNMASIEQQQATDMDRLNRKVEVAKEKLLAIDYVEGSLGQLIDTETALRRQCQDMDRSARNRYLDVRSFYQPPPGFDERNMKGTLASLVDLKDVKYAKALEVVARGQWGDLVVTDDISAKTLLQRKGSLFNRTRLQPLNKLRPYLAHPEVVAEAKSRYGANNVFLAKELLEYSDPEVEPAVNYYFGNTIVCTSMDIAQGVTFGLKMRSVTLDGEDYRPSGVLSGGSLKGSNWILADIDRAKKVQIRSRELTHEMAIIQAQVKEGRKKEIKYTAAKREYDQLCGELEQLKEKMAVGSVGMVKEEILKLEAEIAASEITISDAREEQSTLTTKIKELEEYKKNEKVYREKERKEAEKELKQEEDRLRNLKGDYEKSRETLDALRADIDSMESDLVNSRLEIEQHRQELAKDQKELDRLVDSLAEAKKSSSDSKKDRDESRARVRSMEAELRSHLDEMNKLTKANCDLTAKQKEAVEERSRCVKSYEHYLNKIDQVERKYPWILERRDSLPEDVDYDQAKNEFKRRKERLEELSRIVNPKVMAQLDVVGERHNELLRKLDTLNNEKKNLLTTIGTLNVKKDTEILKAHRQIDKDFGNIFGSLLPGAMATLVPPKDAKNAMSGLEVKVGFNEKWKEGLQELSGGQRSLVALSLILAMLKFNPAPLYILDEVDAALDISHTRNIGRMISSHFKESQFIVVSLKDNLFNYANVLFRTRFVDGSSTVTRTENRREKEDVGAKAASNAR
ncbi:hypothetical protein QR680_004837 [Steinernema hermaphroditum]|uniref:Structural maintenance of chromosomes protein n=1 Tax=Steinernema hermaphroditum TaxID=289476 RepID=A0AA39LUC1_9BILA|nr:hypothetical protein QR680_004830 [Steinernema hermaphroditum]KAK0409922.1 hypothetical protein QR680_004837 [Steinernema hermaphroditum]